MLRVLRGQTYRHLYIAQIVALLGTGLATVALGLLAYDIAGTKAGEVLGTALAIKMIAYVFVPPFASALVACLPRKAVMIGANVLRLGAAVCLPFVGQIWQVYVLIFVLQAASATFTPTFQSVITDVLPEEEDYTAALSLSRLAYDLESVISPMLAAVLLLVVSSSTLFFGTAMGFGASALLVASVLIPHRPQPAAGHSEERLTMRLRKGMVLFARTPALRPILALNFVPAAAGAFVVVQTVVVVRSVFALPESAVAWMLGVNGLGSMMAAFGLPRILRHLPDKRVMLTGAIMLTEATALIPAALAANTPALGVTGIIALWLVIGLGWSSVETPVGRIIRRNVSRSDLPATFAAQFSLQHACWLITYPIVGWLGTASLSLTAIALATLAAAATILAAITWSSTGPATTGRNAHRDMGTSTA